MELARIPSLGPILSILTFLAVNLYPIRRVKMDTEREKAKVIPHHKITPDQMMKAMQAFMAEVPRGYVVNVISWQPKIGRMDTEAGVVSAMILATNPDDVKRFEQVVDRGIAEYRDWFDLSNTSWGNVPEGSRPSAKLIPIDQFLKPSKK